MDEINYCAGWIEKRHQTDEELTLIFFEGCEYCGGADCHDYGDADYLCPNCLNDLRNSKQITRWKVIEEKHEQNSID